MKNKLSFFSVIVLTVLLLSSCAPASNTAFHSQSEQDLKRATRWTALNGETKTTILGDLVVSKELACLVSKALIANPGLQQTLLTLKIRQAENHQTQGELLPEVDGNLSAEKGDSTTSYGSSLSIAWEVDLWKKLADNSLATAKDVAEQEALLQSAQDTLASEVLKSALEIIATRQNCDIQKHRITILEQNESLILQRYRKGLGTLEDLDSARSSLATARATLDEYRETTAQQLRSLQNLLGLSTENEITIPKGYPMVSIPKIDLPEQTLSRRPDLKAAYFAIEAADLRADAAYKDLLPSFNLEAALEDVASSPRAALLSDPAWSLLAQLTVPLFQGGQLKAAARIAELEAEQAYFAFKETLLDAINEVEDTIGLEKSLQRRQKHIEEALTAARSTMTHYQQNYRSGLVNLLDLLDVEEQTFDLEEQLNNLIYDRLTNRVDLGLALGLGVSE